MCELSGIQLFVASWTAVCQGPLSMEFSRQEYWSGLPFSPPGIFNPGIEPVYLYFKLLIYLFPAHPAFCFGNYKFVFCVSLFLLCKEVHLYLFFFF